MTSTGPVGITDKIIRKNFFYDRATVTSTVQVWSSTPCMLICCHTNSTRPVGIGDKIKKSQTTCHLQYHMTSLLSRDQHLLEMMTSDEDDAFSVDMKENLLKYFIW